MHRLKVFLSAYACEPGLGSEPGVGWSLALEMSRNNDVWVLTRERNRATIEQALRRDPLPGVRFVYYDLPRSVGWWKRGARGVQLYYYLWQIGAYPTIRALHQEVGFDLVHHVTFAKYWMPSLLALVPVPFVLGPVGGGESAPPAFWREFSLRGKMYEVMRTVGRWLGEHDPLVLLAVRRSAVVLAKTEETARRLRRLGAKNVRLFPGEGLVASEFAHLTRYQALNGDPVRFVGIGNLLHLKGFHLGLRAFAQAGLPHAEYWIVGDGPERPALEALTRKLGIAAQVRFWGWLPREEALQKLAASHILIHPALHDSGGWVCTEAMTMGRPVICMDLGGPAAQIDEATGLKVRAENPEHAVRDLADAMRRLAADRGLRERLGGAGRQRSAAICRWEHRAELLEAVYRDAVGSASPISVRHPDGQPRDGEVCS